MKLKIEIKTIGGGVLFSFEKENNTIKDTLVQAVRRGANLRYANLQYAYLRGAYLQGAYLQYADLRGANLQYAYLRGAYLQYADLRGAYLQGADLEGADLEGANLQYANLQGAKNIPQSYINQCSRDMLFVFEHLKTELPFLREKLITGHVDGTQYEGSCACLIGSLANAKKQNADKLCEAIPFYDKGLHNYGEQWFYQIRSGDTPENNPFAKHALELIDSVLQKEIKA